MPPYWGGYGGYSYACKPLGLASNFPFYVALAGQFPELVTNVHYVCCADRNEKSAKATREEDFALKAFDSYITTWHNGTPPKEDVIHQLLTPNMSLTAPCCKLEQTPPPVTACSCHCNCRCCTFSL